MPNTVSPAALLAVRICPADVGRRVTVRHRIGGDARLSDVVGTLARWESGVLMVERRDGRVASLPASDLVAAKVVPPEVSVYDVQILAEAGWPPERSQPLGEWMMRWAHGQTNRANSVRVGGDPGRPLVDALEQATRWYADLGAAPRLQVPAPWTHDAVLDELGWRAEHGPLVLTIPTATLAQATVAGRAGGVVVEVARAPDEDWLAMLTEVQPDSRPVYRQILQRPAEVAFVAARAGAGGELLGVGRASAATTRDGRGRWAGITSVETAAPARRRGVALSVLAELAAWADQHRCTTVYLQVFASNTGALALYQRLGFTLHHAYVYRSPTPR